MVCLVMNMDTKTDPSKLSAMVRSWNWDRSPREARAEWVAAGYTAEEVAAELRAQGFSFWDIAASCGSEQITDGQRLIVAATKTYKGKAADYLYEVCWRRTPESIAQAQAIARALAAWAAEG